MSDYLHTNLDKTSDFLELQKKIQQNYINRLSRKSLILFLIFILKNAIVNGFISQFITRVSISPLGVLLTSLILEKST